MTYFEVVILVKRSSLYFNDTLNIFDYMTGHLFTDDCEALLEVDFDQINDGIDWVNSDFEKLNDFVKRRGIKRVEF